MIKLVIYGEPASKENSRKIAHVGPKDNRRTLLIKSEKARNYERDALRQIPPACRVQLQGRVRLTAHIFYASERPDQDASLIRDVLQNRYKKDRKTKERILIQKGVYCNDRQVREEHYYHAIDRRNPRAEIEIELLEPELFETAPMHSKPEEFNSMMAAF